MSYDFVIAFERTLQVLRKERNELKKTIEDEGLNTPSHLLGEYDAYKKILERLECLI